VYSLEPLEPRVLLSGTEKETTAAHPPGLMLDVTSVTLTEDSKPLPTSHQTPTVTAKTTPATAHHEDASTDSDSPKANSQNRTDDLATNSAIVITGTVTAIPPVKGSTSSTSASSTLPYSSPPAATPPPSTRPASAPPAASPPVIAPPAVPVPRQSEIATAQPVPDADEVVVEGAATADRSDYYRVALTPQTRSYQVELSASQDVTRPPDAKQLVLIDGNGNVVGNWTISQPATDLIVDFRPTAPPVAGQVFYLGVTGNACSPAAPAPYEMRISRQDQSEPVSATTATLPATVITPLETSNNQPDAIGVASATSPNGSVLPASDVVPIGLAQGATVPFPLRTAGPPGGILSDADPTPFLDRRSASVVDLALIDLMPDATGADVSEMSEKDVESTPPVIFLQRPGGLPLMTAVRPSDDAPRAASGSATQLAAVAASEPAQPSTSSSAAQTITPRRLGHYQLGLYFAAALSFTMLLPDLSSAFDAFRPRRRPLPRIAGVDFGPEEDRNAMPIG
jgi:hypothetical protein